MIWNIQTAKDISSAAEAVFTLSANTKSVIIDSDSNIYIRFDTTSSADQISTTNDIRWVAGDLRDIPVPDMNTSNKTLGQVYLHVKQVTSVAAKTCRLIEL